MDKPSNPKTAGGGGVSVDLGEVSIAIAAITIAFLVFLALVYSVVFTLFGLAVYLGVRIGSEGKIDIRLSKPDYDKVHRIQAIKEENLKHLKDESPELRQLAEDKFEGEKLAVYRSLDDERAIINVDVEAAKNKVKKLLGSRR
jgi:hypothetical protein